jgi:hypothetical protein
MEKARAALEEIREAEVREEKERVAEAMVQQMMRGGGRRGNFRDPRRFSSYRTSTPVRRQLSFAVEDYFDKENIPPGDAAAVAANDEHSKDE